MKILITGANGQLGNEMRVLSAEHPKHTYWFTDVAASDGAQALDITDAKAVRAFVEAMRELMTDEETRKAMSLQAVAGTHAFQMKQVAAKWLALFNEIQSA